MSYILYIQHALTFEWDEHNINKLARHDVSCDEAESFFDNPRLEEPRTVNGEARIVALGVTDAGRPLTVVYCLRRDSIRVVTAYKTKRKYRRVYEQAIGKG